MGSFRDDEPTLLDERSGYRKITPNADLQEKFWAKIRDIPPAYRRSDERFELRRGILDEISELCRPTTSSCTSSTYPSETAR